VLRHKVILPETLIMKPLVYIFASAIVLLLTLSSCGKFKFPEYPQGEIPNWTDTVATSGKAYNMYYSLAKGNAVVLDFSAMWCSPCITTSPQVDSVFTYFGNGGSNVKVFEFLFQNPSALPSDSSDLSNWETSLNLSMPGFYDCQDTFNEYEITYGSSIPIILVFIPNEDAEDPGNSTLVYDYANGLGVTGGLSTIYPDIKAVLEANGF
jgi:thiol-disulfide isomerase/thioredoxin